MNVIRTNLENLPNYMIYLSKIGCGFQTKHMYRFGWFSMKLKLVGGDSAGVVTAYYVSFISFDVEDNVNIARALLMFIK